MIEELLTNLLQTDIALIVLSVLFGRLNDKDGGVIDDFLCDIFVVSVLAFPILLLLWIWI